MTEPVNESEIISLTISGLCQDGSGIGRHQGLVVFVPGALPGEDVRVRICKRRSRDADGQLLEVLGPSPERIPPACPVAATCGGCNLQHLAYTAQLRQKEQQVADALRRIGHVSDPEQLLAPIIGMDDPWHYRANAQLLIGGTATDPKIGFAAARSHEIVPTPSCPVLPPAFDRIREAVRRYIQSRGVEPDDPSTGRGSLQRLRIRTALASGDTLVVLETRGGAQSDQPKQLGIPDLAKQFGLPDLPALAEMLQQAVSAEDGAGNLAGFLLSVEDCGQHKQEDRRPRADHRPAARPESRQLIAGRPWIEETILGIRYRISAQAFFQVNPRQAACLFAAVRDLAALTGQEEVLDLYCGTGAVALQLASAARRITGIEIDAAAVRDAKSNAAINQIRNARFLAGSAETEVPRLLAQGFAPDLVVLDPPRSGCTPAVLTALIQLDPARVLYISCDPATLARDIARLQPAGYRVTAVQPVDMFPWTSHVETVVLMSRAEAGKA
jgi:23S rRNA (uracil1939-C5)-methyltransferase